MEGKCIMKISEVAKLCDGGYVVCTVEQRDEDGNAVEVELMAVCETYADALAGESILRFDGEDVVIIPPYLTRNVEPREVAKFFRGVWNMDVPTTNTPSFKWSLTI